MIRSKLTIVVLLLLVGCAALGSGCAGTTSPNTTTPATTVTTAITTATPSPTATIVGNVTTTVTTSIPMNQTNCTSEADCAAAQCCHPWGCVNTTFAPECNGTFCTLSCEGPIDCAAGHCGCVNGTCTVIPGPSLNATLTGTTTITPTTTPTQTPRSGY